VLRIEDTDMGGGANRGYYHLSLDFRNRLLLGKDRTTVLIDQALAVVTAPHAK
jgi:hypothetical protein